tara:strand:- start:495 stop:872 length:378 start_codon:yes stop_codon:yes gene_type:complete
MSELKYSKEHEWVRLEGDIATVGISNHAQEQLGDIVYVELPAIGQSFQKNEEAAVVESVKAASEVYAPLSGEIVEINGELDSNPELVNRAPTSDGWFMKIRINDSSELEGMMDESSYKNYVVGEG